MPDASRTYHLEVLRNMILQPPFTSLAAAVRVSLSDSCDIVKSGFASR